MRRFRPLAAPAVLTALLLVFLSRPLLEFPRTHFAPVDIVQLYAPLRVETLRGLGNVLLSDPVLQMYPWFEFNRERLRAGELPLWNPFNAGGVPLLANFQAAVFSPFSLPFYVLDFKPALLLAAFFKLFIAGQFLLLFLRRLGLRSGAALAGAIAFTFNGYNVVWLSWGHVAAVAAVPACLYFAERLLGQPPSGFPFWSFLGLVLSLATGLLAGHPETFLAGGVLLATYSIFRLVQIARHAGAVRAAGTALRMPFAALAGAAVLATALAAVQLLPFFEYLDHSAIVGIRRAFQTTPALAIGLWPLSFFPTLFGMQTAGFAAIDNVIPGTNFNEANGVYIGALALALAVFSLRFWRRRPAPGFFAVCGLIWLLYAYNVAGFGALAGRLPGFSLVVPNRTQVIWLLCVSACLAITIHHLLTPPSKAGRPGKAGDAIRSIDREKGGSWALPGRREFLILTVAGAAIFLAGLLGARQMVEGYATYLMPVAGAFADHVDGPLRLFGGSYVAGLVAALVLWIVPSAGVKRVALAALLTAIFWQGGYALKDYNPVVADRFFYPQTPSVRALQQIAGRRTLLFLGDDVIPPQTNLFYGLTVPTAYDAIGVARFDRLFRHYFAPEGAVQIVRRASRPGLKLFGIEFLVSQDGALTLEGGLTGAQRNAKAYALGEVAAGAEVVQTFRSRVERLSQVRFATVSYARSNQCAFSVRLEEMPAEKWVAEQKYGCAEVQDREVWLRFAPIDGSAGRLYRLVFSSADGRSGNALGLWANEALQEPDASLTFAGQPAAGGLLFDYFSDELQRLDPINDSQLLYWYKGAAEIGQTARFYTVDRAIPAASEEEAWKQVTAPEFDPYRMVVLEPPPGMDLPVAAAPPVPAGTVAVLEETDTRIRLRVNRDHPGYLVLATTHYPGWKATVNGAPAMLYTANYAFNAVAVGAGENLVDFYYDSDTVRAGGLISLASVLLTTGLATGWALAGRRRRGVFRWRRPPT